MPKFRALSLTLALLLLAASLFGQTTQSKTDDGKHLILVQTDSARYGVGVDKLDPKQLGVAIYPGAKVDKGDNDEKGANLSLDWGQKSTHLYVQKYLTPDSPERVLSFYRKQLSQFGTVLECRGGKAVVNVSSSLKCEGGDDDQNIQLKSGTENRQHIVGVTPKDKGTGFAILYLQVSGRGEL